MNLWKWALALCGLVFFACEPKNNTGANLEPQLEKVPENVWKKLEDKKIFFGHQSVGGNIMAGVELLAKEAGANINVVNSIDSAEFAAPVFAHARIGKNRDPITKLNAFKDVLNSGVGEKATTAFVKYCYVDFEENSDPKQVFEQYKKEISAIQSQYPDLDIIHLTTPLTTVGERTFKWRIKKLLGRAEDLGFAYNVKRNTYNELIRKEYGQSGDLFDIAAIQSKLPDGNEASFAYEGNTYPALWEKYTYDGGHLSETGQKKLGAALLNFLAQRSAG